MPVEEMKPQYSSVSNQDGSTASVKEDKTSVSTYCALCREGSTLIDCQVEGCVMM